jgi:membrane associated rhomboid family serine protease
MQYNASDTWGSLPTVTKNIIILNVLMFGVTFFHPFQPSSQEIHDLFSLHLLGSPLFRPWQLLTHMFMHAGVWHIFFNMYGVFMLGSRLEYRWGSQRFLIFYLLCGFGGALAYMSWQQLHIQSALNALSPEELEQCRQIVLDGSGYGSPAVIKVAEAWLSPMMGASGALFGVMAAFGMVFPNVQLMIPFIPVPIRAIKFVIGYACVELALGLLNFEGDHIAHFAHLGGGLVGFILVRQWERFRPQNPFQG